MSDNLPNSTVDPSNPDLSGASNVMQTQPQPPSLSTQPQSAHSNNSSPGAQQVAQNQGGARATSAHDNIRNLAENHLNLLVHASICRPRRNPIDGHFMRCNVLHCSTMKDVLVHMRTCNAGRTCSVPHCGSSRRLFDHFFSCLKSECSLCSSIKKDLINRRNRSIAAQAASSNSLGALHNTSRRPMAPDGNVRNVPNSGNNVIGTQMPQPPAGLSMPNESTPSNNQQPPDSAAQQARHQHAINVTIMRIMSGIEPLYEPVSVVNNTTSSSSSTGQVTASAINETREWYQSLRSISADHRKQNIRSIIMTDIATPIKFLALPDSKVKQAIDFAVRIEGNVYRLAKDRAGYCKLMQQTITKLLRDKRNQIEQQQQQQQPALMWPDFNVCSMLNSALGALADKQLQTFLDEHLRSVAIRL